MTTAKPSDIAAGFALDALNKALAKPAPDSVCDRMLADAKAIDIFRETVYFCRFASSAGHVDVAALVCEIATQCESIRQPKPRIEDIPSTQWMADWADVEGWCDCHDVLQDFLSNTPAGHWPFLEALSVRVRAYGGEQVRLGWEVCDPEAGVGPPTDIAEMFGLDAEDYRPGKVPPLNPDDD